MEPGEADVPKDEAPAGASEDTALAAAAAALADVAAARGRVYAALAAGFWQPDGSLVDDLAAGTFAHEIARSVAWLGPDASWYGPGLRDLAGAASAVRAGPPDRALLALRVEHARLFEGPGRPVAVPFESAWTDRAEMGTPALNGPPAARVVLRYRQAGLERVASHRELPDHVAVELEFLYELCRREAAAWRATDDGTARDLRAAADRFLRDHPSRWWPAFGERVILESRQDLYRGLGRILVAHLSIELGEAIEPSMFPWAAGRLPA